MRLSDLSPARQDLVRLAQRIAWGQILDIMVRGGEPVISELIIVVDIKLDGDAGVRPEARLIDFTLCKEACALMQQLDEIQDGKIEAIHIQAGVPRRMILRSRLRLADAAQKGGFRPDRALGGGDQRPDR